MFIVVIIQVFYLFLMFWQAFHWCAWCGGDDDDDEGIRYTDVFVADKELKSILFGRKKS